MKHTQAIGWQFAEEIFECVWPFYKKRYEKINSILYQILRKVTLISKQLLLDLAKYVVGLETLNQGNTQNVIK